MKMKNREHKEDHKSDLKIEIIISHKGKEFSGYYTLGENEQTWDNLCDLCNHAGAVIRQTSHRNNIIRNPVEA